MPIFIVLPDELDDLSVEPGLNGSISINVRPMSRKQGPKPQTTVPTQSKPGDLPPIILAPLRRENGMVLTGSAAPALLEHVRILAEGLKRAESPSDPAIAQMITYPKLTLRLADLRKVQLAAASMTTVTIATPDDE